MEIGFFYVLSVLLLFGSFFPRRHQLLYLISSLVILFILSGYRHVNIGTDTLNYEQFFTYIKAGGGYLTKEPGWMLLNRMIIALSGDFQTLLIATALLVLMPIFYIARRYSVNPMLTIFLYYAFYFYLQSFNVMRQSIAVAFVLLGLVFLMKERKIIFFILVAIASSFHISALLCFPLVFVNRIPNMASVMYLTLVGISMFIGLLLMPVLLNALTSIIGYSQHTDGTIGNMLGNGLYLVILNSFFAFLLFTSKDKQGVLFKLFFVFIIIANLAARIPLGYRLIMCFSIIQVLFLPYYVYNNKIDKNIGFFVVVIYAYVSFIRAAGDGGILPYYNFLF